MKKRRDYLSSPVSRLSSRPARLTLFGTSVSLTLESGDFRVVRIDLKCLSHIGFHLQTLSAFDMDLGEVDVGVGQFVIPKDRRLERTRRLIAVAAAQMDLAEYQITLGGHRFAGENSAKRLHRIVVGSVLIFIASLLQKRVGFVGRGRYFLALTPAEDNTDEVTTLRLFDPKRDPDDRLAAGPFAFERCVPIARA